MQSSSLADASASAVAKATEAAAVAAEGGSDTEGKSCSSSSSSQTMEGGLGPDGVMRAKHAKTRVNLLGRSRMGSMHNNSSQSRPQVELRVKYVLDAFKDTVRHQTHAPHTKRLLMIAFFSLSFFPFFLPSLSFFCFSVFLFFLFFFVVAVCSLSLPHSLFHPSIFLLLLFLLLRCVVQADLFILPLYRL